MLIEKEIHCLKCGKLIGTLHSDTPAISPTPITCRKCREKETNIGPREKAPKGGNR